MHVGVHRCLCMCVYMYIQRVNTRVMCTFPGIWHPIWSKSILLSWQVVFSPGAGVFLLEILWPDTIPSGGLACPRCPAHILSQHDRLQKEQGQSGTGTENTVPSKGHPLTYWDAKLQETLKNWKESCLSKYSWLAVLFTHKFSQSTWGDFCLKKKGFGYKQNLPCLLALSRHNLVGWPGVSCRFCVLATFLKTGRK